MFPTFQSAPTPFQWQPRCPFQLPGTSCWPQRNAGGASTRSTTTTGTQDMVDSGASDTTLTQDPEAELEAQYLPALLSASFARHRIPILIKPVDNELEAFDHFIVVPGLACLCQYIGVIPRLSTVGALPQEKGRQQ